MADVNEIRLAGTVKDLEVTYDEKYNWHDIKFNLADVMLCDVPVSCYLCCVRGYPEGLLNEGDQVIVSGHLGHNSLGDGKLFVNVQVHEIVHATDIFQR